jgi:hypothetical protein
MFPGNIFHERDDRGAIVGFEVLTTVVMMSYYCLLGYNTV